MFIKGEEASTAIFNRAFRTLKTETAGSFMQPPVIRLGTEDRLIISFDEIAESNSELRYRLLHCNADWQPSKLVESEYIDGFNEADIEDYAWSVNTYVHYVNYRIEIPNENMRPLVSGNYLLQVFDRDEPGDVLLQTRFRILEPLINVGIGMTTRTDRGVNDRYQQLEVVLQGETDHLGNPYQDLKVMVMQNNREDEARMLKAPLRSDVRKVTYAHSPELLFEAGNEFHRFESTSNLFPGMNVDSVRYGGTNYHVWLKPDYPRATHEYEYDRTQHGRFLVKEYNATDSSIGADYITVHFSLDGPGEKEGPVWISGEFTRPLPGGKTEMRYDREAGVWRLEMPLKQGAYNYEYSTPAGRASIDGNKYETENEYTVYVYLRKPGDRADRLIGYGMR